MITFAEKYNWWTPVEQKKGISLESKIEAVLEFGSLEEWRQALKEVNGQKLFEVWEQRIDGKKALPKRKLVLKYFVSSHKNDHI